MYYLCICGSNMLYMIQVCEMYFEVKMVRLRNLFLNIYKKNERVCEMPSDGENTKGFGLSDQRKDAISAVQCFMCK